MTRSYDNRLLAHAARCARSHPAYLGWVLHRYGELENRSADDLAKLLGISALDLPRLSLCLRPRTGHFTNDIRQISEKFHMDASALAGVIRLVESVEALATLTTDTEAPGAGLLMAARARKKQRTRQEKQRDGDA
jgi:hypothetical protein